MSNPECSPLTFRRLLPVCAGLLLALTSPAAASPLGELAPDERDVVEALSLYEDPLRRHALEAAGEADVLGALARQQARSSANFRRLLEPYDRVVQADVYELMRHPELVSELVEGGPKSAKQLRVIAKRYPDEPAAAAIRAGGEYWKLVARTDALLRDENAAFEATIAHLAGPERDAFRALLGAPDLIGLLGDNLGVAVLLGDAYDREPDALLDWLDGLEVAARERKTEDEQELTARLEDDEELAEEVAASTEVYESETGQSAYGDSGVVDDSDATVNPYPYWIGPPWWYPTTYAYYPAWYWWYPHHAWAYGGFRFGPYVGLSIGIGWPHGAFWGWYFGAPYHHHYTPRLTHHVVHHYQRSYPHRVYHHGPRPGKHAYRARPIDHAAGRFVRDTRRSMPSGFLREDGRRVDRLREYGRLHEGRPVGRRVVSAGFERARDDDLLGRARADRGRFPRIAALGDAKERRPREGRRAPRAAGARRDRGPHLVGPPVAGEHGQRKGWKLRDGVVAFPDSGRRDARQRPRDRAETGDAGGRERTREREVGEGRRERPERTQRASRSERSRRGERAGLQGARRGDRAMPLHTMRRDSRPAIDRRHARGVERRGFGGRGGRGGRGHRR